MGACLPSYQPEAAQPHIADFEAADLEGVTPDYHNLGVVFSKAGTTVLLSHRPYNFAINLLPGTLPPKRQLYSMSEPERKAMPEYIQKSQVAGIIRLLSSPAGAGFIFMEKKDMSLRPCIDFQDLNNIMVKNWYPFPLV